MNTRLKNLEALKKRERESYNLRDGEKGITLIALIVTIIVLLILAMVSVNLILRENLIKKAQSAKEEYELAAQEEAESLNTFESEIDKIIGSINGNSAEEAEKIRQLLIKALSGDTDSQTELNGMVENPDEIIMWEYTDKDGLDIGTDLGYYIKNYAYFLEYDIDAGKYNISYIADNENGEYDLIAGGVKILNYLQEKLIGKSTTEISDTEITNYIEECNLEENNLIISSVGHHGPGEKRAVILHENNKLRIKYSIESQNNIYTSIGIHVQM